MRTKTADLIRQSRSPAIAASPGPSIPEADAYWLEDDLGNRVSKLFRTSDSPLRLAGRVLETLGHVDGWTLAWRDVSGDRQVLATGGDLAALATPYRPARSPDEAAHMSRFNEARRRDPAFPTRARAVTDERVY